MSAAAEEDLQGAVDWYNNERAGLGRELLAEVRTTISKIAADPTTSQIVRGTVRRRRVWRFPFDLLYSVEADHVLIVAVAHHHHRRGDY